MLLVTLLAAGTAMMTASSSDLECTTLTDFTDPASNRRWITVNDDVMGGRSDGGFEITNDQLVFEGDINTNGGGFSSIRWLLPEGALQDADALRVRMKTDGRAYNINYNAAHECPCGGAPARLSRRSQRRHLPRMA